MTKNKSLKITAAAMMATTMSLSAVSVAPATALSMPAIAGSQGLPNYPHPVPHKGAPNPQPFGPEYLGGYISDISSHGWGVYLDVVDGFNDVRANHPGVIKQNLDKVVDINNAAQKNPAAIKRAQSDARADKDGVLMAFSDALGGELGRHFRDALRENRLPKTQFLLGNGYLARAGGVASSTFVEKMVFNNDRPFVVAPDRIKKYQDGKRDYYGTSKSYPSGHTNQAVWSTTLLALTLPELAPQILARGSEAGHNRIVMGVHYPLDVMGGRMSGTAAAADRWNDPKMRDAIRQAGKELRAELEWRAGRPISQVVKSDKAYRSTDQAVREYTERMSYGFPKIYRKDAPMVVPQAAPDLLLAKFPKLNYKQRASILRQTAIPSGSPLDDQGPRGSWQRLNMAAAFAAKVKVNGDGSVTVLR
ncbi:phosphatase PAP2 family protein [Corynebacterium sp. c9Ua_112]|uniref:Phosphatase PAP2 family protein n=1 Tax=Corynebacterium macclintockiae TaxID=2913501 RepID=A0A9X3RSM5_9CORY|nr:phosphatase PAP2 family protein [Corynebacterium sp. HMSC058E07]MCZ9304233.1 phosphatase PAP2 family protein [Corynebacterium macclintockiae]OFM58256.1 acid phosphatase [Corynebacterium sp. HMSC058E07]